MTHRLLIGREVAERFEQLTSLAGRLLAGYCPLDEPCHGDVLIEMANGEAPPT